MASNDSSNSNASDPQNETFYEFRNSFSYGSRTDLLFKFLKSGSEQQADDFLRELLHLTDDLIDDGDVTPIVEAIVRAQSGAYAGPGNFEYDDKPFAKLEQPVSESRIALLTTTGHFVGGDDPKPYRMENLTQEQVVKMSGEFGKTDPVLSEIPITTLLDNLEVNERTANTGRSLRKKLPHDAVFKLQIYECARDLTVFSRIPHVKSNYV